MKRKALLILAILTFLSIATGAIFAEDSEPVTEVMSTLVLQIGIIIFAVRVGGRIVKKFGIPPVLGELLAGVAIGPFALGGIPFAAFPSGLFPLHAGSLAVGPELYGFATVASIILLFASGLETDIALFLRYSVAGGIVGIGGVIASFGLGALSGVLLLGVGFMDPQALFLGILSTATSVGITARILSDKKKMDSPEGVTILAAAVFDDVLGIVMLAVVLGIVAVLANPAGGSGVLSLSSIGAIAGRAFGIWLGFTALGLVFSRKIASFLKFFRHSYDFSICALGIGLILAGIFEKEGLAMIIGAYVTGLSLSKTDIATVIQERIHGLYEFFVPLFFAVMGMLVNVGELMSPSVLAFGLIYTAFAIVAKIVGCGLPALALGFNAKGAARIGAGMVPRGEVALIIAGIGITAGILNEQLFGIVILMTLLTTLIGPPLLNATLGMRGRGTRKEAKGSDMESVSWDFGSDEIADLVVDTLLKNLKAEGFYVQMMNIDDGLSQARKDTVALSITEEENRVTIEAAPEDIPFVRVSVHEVIVALNTRIEELKAASDPDDLRRAMSSPTARADRDLLSLISPRCVTLSLAPGSKEAVIERMVNILCNSGKVTDHDQVIQDVLLRERTMSTGLQRGIALPHGKSDGITEMAVAVGLCREGTDFDALDGEATRVVILVVSPKRVSGPHMQFLAAIGGILKDEDIVARLMEAKTGEEAAGILAGSVR